MMTGGYHEPRQAGWYPDPWNQKPLRWHDGHEWTNSVADDLPSDDAANDAGSRRSRRSRRRSKSPAPTSTTPAAPIASATRRVRPVLTVSLIVTLVASGALLVIQARVGSAHVVRSEHTAPLPGGVEMVPDALEYPGATGEFPPEGSRASDAGEQGLGFELRADIEVTLECHPQGVTYSVSNVSEPALYTIDYGDGTMDHTPDRLANPFFGVHTFAGPGPFTVTLGVLGADGHLGSATCVAEPTAPG